MIPNSSSDQDPNHYTAEKEIDMDDDQNYTEEKQPLADSRVVKTVRNLKRIR